MTDRYHDLSDNLTMNDIRIRDRTAADLPQCVAVLTEVHRLDRYPLNWPADPERWLSPTDALHAWVAKTERGSILGHVAVHRVCPATVPASTPAAEVSRLFVAPAARGYNVGTQLLTHAWPITSLTACRTAVREAGGSAGRIDAAFGYDPTTPDGLATA